MTSVEEAAVKPIDIAPVARLWPQLRYVVTRHPLGVFGAAIMAIFVFAAVFADLLTRYDPVSTNAALSLARPDAAHPLGADFMGRDVYSRIIYGAPTSLRVGARLRARRRAGTRLRLSGRLGRPRGAAPGRRHAGPARAGARARHGGRARAGGPSNHRGGFRSAPP